jgi:hypothetical protein
MTKYCNRLSPRTIRGLMPYKRRVARRESKGTLLCQMSIMIGCHAASTVDQVVWIIYPYRSDPFKWEFLSSHPPGLRVDPIHRFNLQISNLFLRTMGVFKLLGNERRAMCLCSLILWMSKPRNGAELSSTKQIDTTERALANARFHLQLKTLFVRIMSVPPNCSTGWEIEVIFTEFSRHIDEIEGFDIDID